MPNITLYYMEASPPCRAVRLTAAALGLPLELKMVNIMEKEHLKPEFTAINRQHCIPTLVDGNVTLWESRVISTYLVSKYGKDDSLYPKDIVTRASVDRLLYFDMGTLSNRFADYFYPLYRGEVKTLDPKKKEKIEEALSWLNEEVSGHDYCVGNHITVADHFIVSTVRNIIGIGVDISKYSNVSAWFKRCCSNMPDYEEVAEKPGKQMEAFIKSILSRN